MESAVRIYLFAPQIHYTYVSCEIEHVKGSPSHRSGCREWGRNQAGVGGYLKGMLMCHRGALFQPVAKLTSVAAQFSLQASSFSLGTLGSNRPPTTDKVPLSEILKAKRALRDGIVS